MAEDTPQNPESSDDDVEGHLLKEALAAGAAAGALFAGSTAASAQIAPEPGGSTAGMVMPEPGGGSGGMVQPGPGGGSGGALIPEPGGASGNQVQPGPGGSTAAKAKGKAGKVKKAARPAQKKTGR